MAPVKVIDNSLHDILRNAVPGYVFVFLIAAPYILSNKLPLDTSVAAIIVVAGPIFGALLFNTYEVLQRKLVWKCEHVRKFLGLTHVDVLIKIGKEYNLTNEDMLTVWDLVFLGDTSEEFLEYRERGFVLFSRAHLWGVLFFDSIVVSLVWLFRWLFAPYCSFRTLCIVTLFPPQMYMRCLWLVVIANCVVSLLLYRWTFGQAGPLVFYLASLKLKEIRRYAKSQSKFRKDSVKLTPNHS